MKCPKCKTELDLITDRLCKLLGVFYLVCPKCKTVKTGYYKACRFCRGRKLIEVRSVLKGNEFETVNWKCLRCNREFKILSKEQEDILKENLVRDRKLRMMEKLEKKYSLPQIQKRLNEIPEIDEESRRFLKAYCKFKGEQHASFERIKERFGIDMFEIHKEIREKLKEEERAFKISVSGKSEKELEKLIEEEERKIEEILKRMEKA